MKYLIVGLGNPGKEYENTRHNVGFMVINALAKRLELELKSNKKFACEIAIGDEAILVKPSTFMNLSGQCISTVKNFYKVENNNIILISDDANLEIGQVRIRLGGESGGHKGLESTIGLISNNFWRIRVGIGQPENNIPLEDFVLQKFAKEELRTITAAVDKAARTVIESISQNKIENVTL